jgi:PAS domain S-box-containing protein
MSDINDQKRPVISEKFYSSNELHRILFEEAADGMFIADPHWRYIAVNPQYCKMIGYSSRELIELIHLDLIAPENFALDPVPMEDFHQGKSVTKERPFVRKDGSLILVEIHARMLPEGNILGIVRDISERKKAETALIAEKQFSNAIIDSIPGILAVFNDQGNNLRWNKNLEIVVGYTAEELKSMNAFQTIAEEDQDLVATGMRETFEKGHATIAARVLTKDKRKIPFLINGLAAMIGGKQYLVTTGIDITERKRAEEAIACEKKLSGDIINSLPGIFYMLDGEGKLVRWNTQFEEVTGYSSEELLDRNVLDFFSEEYKQYLLSRVQFVFAEGESFAEVPLLTKNRTRIPYFFTGRLATLDGRQYLLGVGIDTTERKRAEEAIARERSLADDIINSLPGIFYMYDDKGKLVRWNRKHEEATGYSREELLGMNVLDFFAEEHKKYLLSCVQSVFTEGESLAEAPLLIKNGSQVPYLFTGRLATLDGNKYLLGVGIDITERKKAEEEKNKLQTQLSQSQKLETIGRLAGGGP